MTTANAMVSVVTTAGCEQLLGPGRTTTVDTQRAVGRLLLGRPGKRMLRLEVVAEELRMPAAQSHKRLYRAGTSYKSIVFDLRMKLVPHYLESTHPFLQDIAYLLDYSRPGPLSLGFKKYFGVSPNATLREMQELSSSAH